MKKQQSLLVCLLLLLGAQSPLSAEPAAIDKEINQAQEAPNAPAPDDGNGEEGKQAREKDAANDAPQPVPVAVETVHILDTDFPVPEPWTGKRVRVPQDTVANLVPIPLELTLNGTEIALRREALAPLERMAAAASADGVRLLVDSGYRSAVYQRAIYERRMGEGQSFERIARHTAPPGYSRHALGVAVDFHPSASGFQHTSAYRWLRRHARHYGFYERYHKNNTLGVIWEPWHWEYRLERNRPADRPTQPATSSDRQAAPTDAAQPAAAQGQSDNTASPEPEPEPETAPQ